MSKLGGRVALVTGAGRGIGRAIALACAREGADIAASGRNKDELDDLAREVRDLGAKAVAIRADLSDPHSPREIVARTLDEFRTVDILVNNAGVGSSANPRPFVDFDDAFWNYTLALNLTAPYLLCKAVMPILLERKKGRIINIASISSKTGTLHGCAYSASKHGLLGLTRSLALETAGTGITVNAICPGVIHTAMNDARIDYDSRRLGVSREELEARSTPLGRRLEPEEVAPYAVFLASDEASAISGQAVNVCGGALMY